MDIMEDFGETTSTNIKLSSLYLKSFLNAGFSYRSNQILSLRVATDEKRGKYFLVRDLSLAGTCLSVPF